MAFEVEPAVDRPLPLSVTFDYLAVTTGGAGGSFVSAMIADLLRAQ